VSVGGTPDTGLLFVDAVVKRQAFDRPREPNRRIKQ